MKKKNVFLSAFLAVMLLSSTAANAAGFSESDNKYQDIKTMISTNVQSASETIENNFKYAMITVEPQEITETIATETPEISETPEIAENVSSVKTANLSGNAIVNDMSVAGTSGIDRINNDKMKLNNVVLNSMSSTYIDPSFMTQRQRNAAKMANRYASADWDMTAEPVNNQYDSKTLWVRPYATFESVETKSTSDVSNVAYGMYFGGDSEVIDLGNGWENVFGLHVGYNGSHQAWHGNSAYQNGGTFGVTGTFFKGNFFDTITFGAGATAGSADILKRNNKYMEDDFAIFNTGVANKVGYNFETENGKFVVQPSFLTSYTYGYTYNSNIPDFKRSNQHLHSIGLEPGVKFIGNLDNGWQPYASVSVVWNLMTKRYNFRPYQVSMPELAAKPYVRYGVGLKKTWNDNVSGFIQAHITNGGRTGVGLQAGFRWTVGN